MKNNTYLYFHDLIAQISNLIGLEFIQEFLIKIISFLLWQTIIWGFTIVSFTLLFSLLISGYLGKSVKERFSVMINERSFYINIFI